MSSWIPIINPSSRLAERAWEAIHAICAAIEDHQRDSVQGSRVRHEISLLYGYLALACRNQEWLDRAVSHLNTCIQRDTASLSRRLGLYGGLCGLGWTVEHLSRFPSAITTETLDASSIVNEKTITEGEDQDVDEDLNSDVDGWLRGALQSKQWMGHYDLIGGLVGFGVYCFERLPGPQAFAGLHLILSQLEACSEEIDSGYTWHTRPELLPPHQLESYPLGYYNLGIAHGVPGVIFLLSELNASNFEPERTRRLLNGAVKWLLSRKRPSERYQRFGAYEYAKEVRPSRLAWCYGDLGIAHVLIHAGHRVGREDWLLAGRHLVDNCLSWPAENSGVADAPLCHGAMGVAHCFNRLFQRDGDYRCREAALQWSDRAFSFRDGSPAGFFTAKTDRAVEFTFLDGVIGVALGLLAALTPIEPRWDRIMLLSAKTFPHRT
jgi:hypothetical protein